MKFLKKNNIMQPSIKNSKFIIIALVSIALIFLLHFTGIIRPVENLIVTILKPAQTAAFNISFKVKNFYQQVSENRDLQAENDQLKLELNQLLIDKSKLILLEEENVFLQKQLDFSATLDHDLVSGRVIGLDRNESSRLIIIDKGKKNKVFDGYPVVVDDGYIIGKVYKAYDKHSIVKLINDHSSQLAITILNTAKTIGIAQGEFGLGVKIDLIPQNEKIDLDDIVITSGLEDNIPRGLVVGTVEEIFGADEEIFKQASIKLPIDFDKIIYISVIIPHVEEN
ncbi:rod shape-determining protein MreC [Candidatus Falkowbacteria bacterium RIFOXYD2_FULL_35_9]|uniref:Cell shape-determining protein MreC n=1 Tax=Candidatus Falkowbacteria bacterium RIFOXYC2_FULL_36_12 TaxID=1798002 RepID=A0A1F5SYU7_9BACT|nr:MAG: rod shape-determining protein MreC [Candidatus Falkowbacteria bacterium RIFOXYC2_FULL_36_12]OGF46893.1 MAG: rod shape-determining protein MreC [Candidatus Falkowbacteria bacterium RIFOXYD2_FULL_35_9]